jgi:hypothetical protein
MLKIALLKPYKGETLNKKNKNKKSAKEKTYNQHISFKTLLPLMNMQSFN